MPSIYNWDVIPANNATADADLTWAEGQAPSTVNNSGRQMMARSKELLIDLGGSLTVGGTANAITLAAQSAFTTHDNGRIVSFKATTDNTGATSLNVNSIGSKAVVKMTEAGESPLLGAELQAGGIYTVQYTTALDGGSGAWLLMNPTLPFASFIQPGMLMDYAGTTAPTGWLFCYGQAISRTTYAALFAVISTTYGVGDGTSTFNVPDLRGRVIAGKDDMGGSSANRLTTILNGDNLGATGGTETFTQTTSTMPAHSHGGTSGAAGAHTHTLQVFMGNGGSIGGIETADTGTSEQPTSRASVNGVGDHTHTITSEGSGTAHSITQPTIIANKIIKF